MPLRPVRDPGIPVLRDALANLPESSRLEVLLAGNRVDAETYYINVRRHVPVRIKEAVLAKKILAIQSRGRGITNDMLEILNKNHPVVHRDIYDITYFFRPPAGLLEQKKASYFGQDAALEIVKDALRRHKDWVMRYVILFGPHVPATGNYKYFVDAENESEAQPIIASRQREEALNAIKRVRAVKRQRAAGVIQRALWKRVQKRVQLETLDALYRPGGRGAIAAAKRFKARQQLDLGNETVRAAKRPRNNSPRNARMEPRAKKARPSV